MLPGVVGLLVGGGALTAAGLGRLAGASMTNGQAQAPGLTFDEWSKLGDRGRTLNTASQILAAAIGDRRQCRSRWGRRVGDRLVRKPKGALSSPPIATQKTQFGVQQVSDR